MLYVLSEIPCLDQTKTCEKEALICVFHSTYKWAHAKLMIHKAIGPSFDVARPENTEQKEWCKAWKKLDRWRVCRSLRQETDFYSEIKSKAVEMCRYKGLKGMKMISRSFNSDIYPLVCTVNGVRCPWMDDHDQGKKKKELYSMDETTGVPTYLRSEYRIDQPVPAKTLQSLEELELEFALRGWGLEQVFVRAVAPGYGWIIYPWNLAKTEGRVFCGLNDAQFGYDKKTTSNGATNCAWEKLLRKIENGPEKYVDDDCDLARILESYSYLM